MIRPVDEIRVPLCRAPVDFRKQMRGLSVLVQEELALDPFCAHLFAFCNRRRDHVKLLYWERNGFVLWQKKLEQDRFPWPRDTDTRVVEFSGRELNWLLDGLDVFAMKPHGDLLFDSAL
ncbi:MAG: IS66 family insertion sequence element accessory protein TnpB [Proteobacteria bacterium]|nr:IS66 family insertion sequence element accessory protein TnpB [Pseudomonadota bacterium]